MMQFYSYEYLDLNDIMNFRNSMEQLWYEDMQGNIILEANICEQETIDFGKAQIGESIFQDLVLKNPYSYPLTVQLFIGTDFQNQYPKEEARYAQAAEIRTLAKRILKLKSQTESQYEQFHLIRNDSIIQQLSLTKTRIKYLEQIRSHAQQMTLFCFNQEQEDYIMTKVSDPHFFFNQKRQKAIQNTFAKAYELLKGAGIQLGPDFLGLETHQKCTNLIQTLVEEIQTLWMVDWAPLQKIQQIFGELNFSEIEQKENFVNKKFAWFARQPSKKEKDYTITGFSYNTFHSLSQISYMDYLMFDDIVKATYTDPFLPPKHKYQLGFPNIIEARFGWLRQAFKQSKQNAIQAIQSSDVLALWLRQIEQACVKIKEKLSISDLMKKLWITEPVDIPVSKAVQHELEVIPIKKNAFEWQYSLTDYNIQKEVQKSTQKSSQHFFLNFDSTPRTVVIPGSGELVLHDFLVFQPHTVKLDQSRLKAQLYLKVPHQLMRMIKLVGTAYANIMDVKEVNKIGSCVRFLTPVINNAVFQSSCLEEQQHEANKMPCDFYKDDQKWQTVDYEGRQLILDTKFLIQSFTSCLDMRHQQLRIFVTIFEQTKVSSLIQLTVTENDILSRKERVQFKIPKIEQSLEYFFSSQPEDIMSLKWHHELDAYNTDVQTPIISDFRLNKLNAWQGLNEVNGFLRHQTEWIVRLFNLRGGEVSFYNVMLQDPVTGLLACEIDGLSVDNCNSKQLSSSDMLDVRLLYTNQFTVTQVKANLVLLSADWSQRFEVVLEISPNALSFANKVADFTIMKGYTFLYLIPILQMGIVMLMIFIATQIFMQKSVLTLLEIDGQQLKTFFWAYIVQTLQFSLQGLLFLVIEVLKVVKYIAKLIIARFGLDATIDRLVFEWNQLELGTQTIDSIMAFNSYLAQQRANRQKLIRLFRYKIELERKPPVEPKRMKQDLSFLQDLKIFPCIRMPIESPVQASPSQIQEVQQSIKQKPLAQALQPFQRIQLHTEEQLFEALEQQSKKLKGNERLKTYLKMSQDNTAIEIHVEILSKEEVKQKSKRSKVEEKIQVQKDLGIPDVKQDELRTDFIVEEKFPNKVEQARQDLDHTENKQGKVEPAIKEESYVKREPVLLDLQDLDTGRKRSVSEDFSAKNVGSRSVSKNIESISIHHAGQDYEPDLAIPHQEAERPSSPSTSLNYIPQEAEQPNQINVNDQLESIKYVVEDASSQVNQLERIQSVPEIVQNFDVSYPQPELQLNEHPAPQISVQEPEPTLLIAKKKRKRSKKAKETQEFIPIVPQTVGVQQNYIFELNELSQPEHQIQEVPYQENDAKSENPFRTVYALTQGIGERAQSEMAQDDFNRSIAEQELQDCNETNEQLNSEATSRKRKRKRSKNRNSSLGSKTSNMSDAVIDNIKDLLDDFDDETVRSVSEVQSSIMVDTIMEGETIKISKHKKTRLRKKALKEAYKNIKSIFEPVQSDPVKQPVFAQEFKPATQSRIFGGTFSLFDNPDGGTLYENALRQQHSDFDKTSRGDTVDDDQDFEFDISAAILQSNIFDRKDRKKPFKSPTSKLSLWNQTEREQEIHEDIPARQDSLFGSMMQAFQPVQKPSNFQGLHEIPSQAAQQQAEQQEGQVLFSFEWKNLETSQEKFKQMQLLAQKLQRQRKDDPTDEL